MKDSKHVHTFPLSGSRLRDRIQCPNCFTLNLVWLIERKDEASHNDDAPLQCALCGTLLPERRILDSSKAA